MTEQVRKAAEKVGEATSKELKIVAEKAKEVEAIANKVVALSLPIFGGAR